MLIFGELRFVRFQKRLRRELRSKKAIGYSWRLTLTLAAVPDRGAQCQTAAAGRELRSSHHAPEHRVRGTILSMSVDCEKKRHSESKIATL